MFVVPGSSAFSGFFMPDLVGFGPGSGVISSGRRWCVLVGIWPGSGRCWWVLVGFWSGSGRFWWVLVGFWPGSGANNANHEG